MGHGPFQRTMVFNDRTDEGAVAQYLEGLIRLPALQSLRQFSLVQVGLELVGGEAGNHDAAVQRRRGGATEDDGSDSIPLCLDPGDHFLDQGQFIGPTDAYQRFALGNRDPRFEID